MHDANVTVSDGEKMVALSEICWNDFTPEEQELLEQILADLGVGGLENIAANFLCLFRSRF